MFINDHGTIIYQYNYDHIYFVKLTKMFINDHGPIIYQ